MRQAKQSRALQIHNGDTVSKGRGGEREQTEHKSFTNNLSQGIQQDRSDWDTQLTPCARGEAGVISLMHSGRSMSRRSGRDKDKEEISELGYGIFSIADF